MIHTPSPAWVVLAGLSLGLTGCGERIRLPAGDHVLTYTCRAVRSQASSNGDRKAVKTHALTLVRSATEVGNAAAVRTMVGALASGKSESVERELVQLLCEHPEWLPESGLPAANGPSDRYETPGNLVLPLLALPSDSRSAPDTFRLSDVRGRWVYLDVFGSWCPPCREKYPAMARLAEHFGGVGDEAPLIVGLLLNDAPERALAFFDDYGGSAYPVAILDPATVATWGITGAPMGFLIGPDGRIRRRCYGCQRGPLSVAALEKRFSTN